MEGGVPSKLSSGVLQVCDFWGYFSLVERKFFFMVAARREMGLLVIVRTAIRGSGAIAIFLQAVPALVVQ